MAFPLQNYTVSPTGTGEYGAARYLADSALASRARADVSTSLTQLIPKPDALESAAASTTANSTSRTLRQSATANVTTKLTRQGILRDQFVLSGNNALSSSLDTLAGGLRTTIGRPGGTSSLGTAAGLYRGMASSLAVRDLMPSGTSMFSTVATLKVATAASPIRQTTESGLQSSFSAFGDAVSTATVYLRTGALRQSSPQLLDRLFA